MGAALLRLHRRRRRGRRARLARSLRVAAAGARACTHRAAPPARTRLACQSALATLTLARPWQPSPSPHPTPWQPTAGLRHSARALRRRRASRRAALPRGGRRRRGDRGVDVGQAASTNQRGRLFPLLWKQRVQRRLCPWAVTITVMGRPRATAHAAGSEPSGRSPVVWPAFGCQSLTRARPEAEPFVVRPASRHPGAGRGYAAVTLTLGLDRYFFLIRSLF